MGSLDRPALIQALTKFSEAAAVIRAAALGARVDVLPGGHTDHLLKALEDHADLLENSIRRFLSETVHGIAYVDPPLDREATALPTH